MSKIIKMFTGGGGKADTSAIDKQAAELKGQKEQDDREAQARLRARRSRNAGRGQFLFGDIGGIGTSSGLGSSSKLGG